MYNKHGQEILKLAEDEVYAGMHEAVFEASGLQGGVNIYRLQAGEYMEIKKLLYLK